MSKPSHRTPNAPWQRHFVIDVEADGPCPGLYNMISFGIVPVADPKDGYLGEVAPMLDHGGKADARAISGISLEVQRTYRPADIVMAEAFAWLSATSGGGQLVFWSDNPAFDWQFWNYYSHRFIGHNPFGHSARRIGDVDAGRRRAVETTSAWKKNRNTPHTHNPLDDARANAEGLRWVLGQCGERLRGLNG